MAILDFGLRQVGLWWSDYELVSHPDQFRQRFGLHLLHDAGSPWVQNRLLASWDESEVIEGVGGRWVWPISPCKA